MNENPSQTVSTGNSPFKVWIPFREFASNIYQHLSVSIKQVLQVCYWLFVNEQYKTFSRVTGSRVDFHESRASQSLGHDNASSPAKDTDLSLSSPRELQHALIATVTS